MAKSPFGDPFRGTINFDAGLGDVLMVNAGSVHVHGTWTTTGGPMRQIFAAVAEGDVANVPPHPWHDGDLEPTEGNANGDNTWSCDAITARGNCELDTVFVWGFFQGIDDIKTNRKPFWGDSSGTGCGERVAGTSNAGIAQQIFPRFYRVTPNVTSMALSEAGRNFLVGSGILDTGIVLEYDEDQSTSEDMIWRSIEITDLGAKWSLRVSQGMMRLEAVALMQRTTEESVRTPFAWQCSQWDANGCNVMQCDMAKVGYDLPNLFVEPIE